MDARAVTIRELLQHRNENGLARPVQFRVPVFQRTYEWRAETVRRLVDDVLDRIDAGAGARPHFLGSFVLLDEVETAGQPDHLMVIDGQQRLLTISIAIALAERRLGTGGPSWLANPGFGAASRDRVRPARVDRPAFDVLVAGGQLNAHDRLARAADTIGQLLADREPAILLDALLDKLLVVRVLLDHAEDAETVFQSLNYTGQPLTQADLVRTYLLSRFEQVEDQEHVDDKYWRPMEQRLRDSVPDRQARGRVSPKDTITDWYLREWLMRNGGRVDQPRVYQRFIETVASPAAADAEVALNQLDAVSAHYVRLEAPSSTDVAGSHLVRIKSVGYNVHFPLMLQLYERVEAGSFPAQDLARVIEAIDSLFVRRAVVNWPTNRLGRLFESIAESRPAGAAAIWPFMEPHWPSDSRFKQELLMAPLYKSEYPARVVRLLLRELDLAYGNPESKTDPEATIEHVMPQTIRDDPNGRAWKAMLGADWERIYSRWLHTLGNLSMTRTNSQMSNRPFLGANGKREWLSKSLFEMNRQIALNDSWAEPQMEARAGLLADSAVKLWPGPEAFSGKDGA